MGTKNNKPKPIWKKITKLILQLTETDEIVARVCGKSLDNAEQIKTYLFYKWDRLSSEILAGIYDKPHKRDFNNTRQLWKKKSNSIFIRN